MGRAEGRELDVVNGTDEDRLCWPPLMMKRWLALAVLCASLSVTSGASAQAPAPAIGPELGQRGGLAISVDRLFGFAYSSSKQSMNGVDGPTTTTTGFSLLGNPLGSVGSTFSAPRLAVDAFVSPGLSVGWAVGVVYTKESVSQGATTGADLKFTGFAIDPRLGYLARISPAVAVWPRAGVSFLYLSLGTSAPGSSGASSSQRLLAATLEVPFAFTVAPRVVFLLGPTLDVSFYGKETTTPAGGGAGTTTDLKALEVGAHAGLMLLL